MFRCPCPLRESSLSEEGEAIEDEKTSRKYEEERKNTNIVLVSRTRLLLLGFGHRRGEEPRWNFQSADAARRRSPQNTANARPVEFGFNRTVIAPESGPWTPNNVSPAANKLLLWFRHTHRIQSIFQDIRRQDVLLRT